MIGTTLGSYEIVAKIGEGGMGEVYRARDTRLDRDVAIKVMTTRRLDSEDARARFERENKAVASLSHPNILAIYEFGEHEGLAYAVTELLEGQSLRELLDEGPLSLRRALQLAAQMSDGLAAAHEKGIVHRDLKPANVFLTRDGQIKILDFGLAKTGLVDSGETLAATRVDQTTPGTVMGTVRYMAPEQVRGESVDARADIFSFGAVLWEMLGGQSAFERDSAIETMNAILKEDPTDFETSDVSVPAAVQRILHRCLEKQPELRFQSARDLAFALRNGLDSSSREYSGPVPALPASGPRSRAGLWIALGLVVGGALGFLGHSLLVEPPITEPAKIRTLTHSTRDFGPSASPDGNTVAFVSDRDGTARIWLRQMSGGNEVPLTDGEDSNPQFSPDGTSILFTRRDGASLSVYRCPLVGGMPRKLLGNVWDAAWSPDGSKIAFLKPAGSAAKPAIIFGRYDLGSGEESELVRLEDEAPYGLEWSPDGRWISCSSTSSVMNTSKNWILLIDPSSGEVQRAMTSPTALSKATWASDSKSMIVAQSTSILGDLSGGLGRVLRLDPFGDGEKLLFWVQSVWAGASDYVSFDYLNPHAIVFDEILWTGNLSLIRLDGGLPVNSGAELTRGSSRDRQPAYSPDGKRVVFSSNRSGNLDVWVMDLESGALQQITDDAAEDWDPAFTRDGEGILWSSNRSGNLEIWMSNADGSRARQLSQDGDDAENPTQTADGEWVVYASGNTTKQGVWKIRMDGSDARRLDEGSYFLPEISPDGRHVVYIANDVDNFRVLISVMDLESEEVVFHTSTLFRGFQTLIQPGRTRWSPDGRSLIFLGASESGQYNLYSQDFAPGQDTIESRRLLCKFERGKDIESFGIAPDGKSAIVARIGHLRSLKLAEGDFD